MSTSITTLRYEDVLHTTTRPSKQSPALVGSTATSTRAHARALSVSRVTIRTNSRTIIRDNGARLVREVALSARVSDTKSCPNPDGSARINLLNFQCTHA